MEVNETAESIDEVNPSSERDHQTQPEIEHMEIDTRRPEWCWQPVKAYEVCDALRKTTRMTSLSPLNPWVDTSKHFSVFTG